MSYMMDMMGLAELAAYLRRLRQERGWSLREASLRLGISHQHINILEKGQAVPKVETLMAVAHGYGVPVEELVAVMEERSSALETSDAALVRVPEIGGSIHAGNSVPPLEDVVEWHWVPAAEVRGGEYFVMRVRGDCMEGGPHPIRDGYRILVRAQPVAEDGQVAVVFLPGESEAVLRRVRKTGRHIVLTADNPAYPPIVLEPRQVRIVGIVKRVWFEPAPLREV